jgi:ribosome-associated protein
VQHPEHADLPRLGPGWHAVRVPGPLKIRGSVVVPEAELYWRFSRSSGPGGQSVNTADSRVELSWDLESSEAFAPAMKERARERLAGRLVNGVVTVAASEHRSQYRNRLAAEERLAALLAEALAPPPRQRRATRPSRGSVERRLASKARRSQTKRMRRNTDD